MHLKLVCQLPFKHQRRIVISVTINSLVTLAMSTRSSKVSAKRCAVSCCASRTSLHKLPKDPDERKKWIQFIFKECPTQVDPELRVCSVHFSNDCFENKAQYDASFAKKLLLKDHAVPTVLDPTETPQNSPSWSERKKDVSCQTDAPSRRTVRTQLSHRTVLSYRSKGTQTQPLITTGVDSTKHPTTLQSSTSTPLEDKKPCSEVDVEAEKESEAEEEVEVEAEDGIEVEEERVCETQDTTCDPPENDSSRLFMETEGADEDKKYVVFESCLLELFETCPVCTRACDVQHISTETFVAFDQLCPHCHYFRQWKSQLIP